MKKVLEILEDKDGYLSFKRFTGLMAFAIAVILAFTSGDTSLVNVFLIYSGGCGALTIPDNIKQGRKNAQQNFDPF